MRIRYETFEDWGDMIRQKVFERLSRLPHLDITDNTILFVNLLFQTMCEYVEDEAA